MSNEDIEQLREQARNHSNHKIYLHTSDLNTKFPHVFVASKNPRTIQVKWCRALYNGKLVGDIMVHADFVQRDYYLDHFICFTNTGDSQKYIAKYDYLGTTPDFNVWFTDIAGNSIDVDGFVLSLLLTF